MYITSQLTIVTNSINSEYWVINVFVDVLSVYLVRTDVLGKYTQPLNSQLLLILLTVNTGLPVSLLRPISLFSKDRCLEEIYTTSQLTIVTNSISS